MKPHFLVLGVVLLAAGCSYDATSPAEQADAERAAAEALREHQKQVPNGIPSHDGGAQAAAGLLR